MQEKNIEAFIDWFEERNPLPQGYSVEQIYFDNNYETYQKYADILSKKLLQNGKNNSKNLYGAAFIGYGFSTGAIISNNKPLTLTHQIHYDDTPVWYQNVSSLLNIDADKIYFANGIDETKMPSDEIKRQTEIGEYLKWLINPEGNAEIFDDVFQRLCFQMIKEVDGRLPGRNRRELRLIVPLISDEVGEPDWELLLSELKINDIHVSLEGPANLFPPAKNERKYIIFEHDWDFNSCVIIQVLELSQLGTPVTIGAYGWLDTDENEKLEIRELKNLGKTFVQLSPSQITGNFNTNDAKQKNNLEFNITTKFDINDGFRSFLGQNFASFYEEFYQKREGIIRNDFEKQIYDVMPENKSVNIASICAKLCNEKNLYNISLSDMVNVGIALENKSLFKTTTLITNKEFQLTTNKHILPQETYNLEQFPANYDSITWKNKPDYKAKDNYLKMKDSDLRTKPVDLVIQIIINHYISIKTSELAEELFFIFGIRRKEPAALFVARLFGYMCKTKKFVIDKKSTEVEEI